MLTYFKMIFQNFIKLFKETTTKIVDYETEKFIK